MTSSVASAVGASSTFKTNAANYVTQATGFLNSIGDLISGGSDSDNDSDNDSGTAECIDDDTTPQACLDKWVREYPFNVLSCFFRGYRLRYTQGGVPQFAYAIYYGGCGARSVDTWFDRTPAQWADPDLLTSTGANLTSNGSTRKMFNLKTGGVDRVGFRIPAD